MVEWLQNMTTAEYFLWGGIAVFSVVVWIVVDRELRQYDDSDGPTPF